MWPPVASAPTEAWSERPRPAARLHVDRAYTISNNGQNAVNDPAALALRALGWILSDEARASRLLALTGLSPDDLRTRLGSAEVQRAVLEFLGAHEPDLIAAADALGVAPGELAAAGERLGT